MNTVEYAIQKALQAIPVKAMAEKWQGEKRWSVAVKSAIIGIGREFDCLTASNGCETDEGKEWLYDVVWYKSDREGHIIDVPLVAECEWGCEKAIKEDFEKLLVSRSTYRVMVFQGNSEEVVHSLFRKMRMWIGKFSGTTVEDRYLLAGWARNHWIFESHVE
ncbi:MAG: hypothetical protein AB7T38_07785 [Nitrospirales bacterium]